MNIEKTLTIQAGLTLVELMISLSISMLLILAVGSFYIANKSSYNIEEQLARLQESGRYANYYLTQEIRNAGFQGCSDSSEVKSFDRTVLVTSESPESKTNITLQLEHPVSLLQSHFDGSLNLDKSVLIGINPSLCAKPSSGNTDEFSIMSTVSIANT